MQTCDCEAAAVDQALLQEILQHCWRASYLHSVEEVMQLQFQRLKAQQPAGGFQSSGSNVAMHRDRAVRNADRRSRK